MNNQSFITRLIIKTGLAKNEKQAPIVLLAIAALAVAVMFVIWPSANTNESMPDPSSPMHPINQ